MESAVMEEHIKYEAEESQHLIDHVWEEVVIEDSTVATWTQDLEMEEDMSADVTMDSTVSEGPVPVAEETVDDTPPVEDVTPKVEDVIPEVEFVTPKVEDVIPGIEYVTPKVEDFIPGVEDFTPEAEYDTSAVEDSTPAVQDVTPALEDYTPAAEDYAPAAEDDTSTVEDIVDTISETITGVIQLPAVSTETVVTTTQVTRTLPVVTNVRSLAPRPAQKVVKILPKGGFINIGNRKMKLVPLTGGKLVAMSGGDSKNMIRKVITLSGSPDKKVARVVTVGGNNNISAGNIVNSKLLPAKVVSVNPKLRPIAPSPGKEVTIYITGLAGDKVQIRDSVNVSKLQVGDRVQLGQREVELDSWRSDHMDACLPSENVETVVVTPNMMTDGHGHFLLDSQSCDVANLTCNICDRQFTQLKYLLSHQQTHLLAEPVACESCGKSFKRRYDLLRHKRRAHADQIIYECEVCHKTFSDRLSADRHRLMHTDEFKFCCEVCSRPFKYVNDLKRHRSIHFDDKPFDCEICGKKFKHKSNLKTHQSTHYSEKPYSCTLCDKRFHQKGNLKTHLIVHTGEMPFVCNICTKRFHTRSGLLNHSYSHSDEKPFECEICQKTFNWKSGLLTHQQTHRPRSMSVGETPGVQVIEIGPIPVDPSMAVETEMVSVDVS